MLRWIAACLLAALTIGCIHSSQVTWKLDDPDVMRTVVLQHVPPGTSLETATAFMTEEGFGCEVQKASDFYERRSWMNEGAKHEGLDFLNCNRRQSAGELLMFRDWSVAVILDGDVVSDVLVAHYVDGP